MWSRKIPLISGPYWFRGTSKPVIVEITRMGDKPFQAIVSRNGNVSMVSEYDGYWYPIALPDLDVGS